MTLANRGPIIVASDNDGESGSAAVFAGSRLNRLAGWPAAATAGTAGSNALVSMESIFAADTTSRESAAPQAVSTGPAP